MLVKAGVLKVSTEQVMVGRGVKDIVGRREGCPWQNTVDGVL